MTKKLAVKFSTRWVRIINIKHMANSGQEGGKIKINKYPKESLGWGNKKIFSSHCNQAVCAFQLQMVILFFIQKVWVDVYFHKR